MARLPSDVAGDEATRIVKMLASAPAGCRLVTISGPSGCGKTHVARRAAEALKSLGYLVSPCRASLAEAHVARDSEKVAIIADPAELFLSSSPPSESNALLDSFAGNTSNASSRKILIATILTPEDAADQTTSLSDDSLAVARELLTTTPFHVKIEPPTRQQRESFARSLLPASVVCPSPADCDLLSRVAAGLNFRDIRAAANAPRSAPPAEVAAGDGGQTEAYIEISDVSQALRTAIDNLVAQSSRKSRGGDANTERDSQKKSVAEASRRHVNPTGILLVGPSGVGKTFATRYVERHAKVKGVRVLAVSAPALFGKWLGQTEMRVRQVFDTVRASAQPTVVVIDELDAIGKKRGHGSSGEEASNAGVRALSALLCELDGVVANTDSVVVGMTSVPWQLDPALLRQGRFEKIIGLAPPGDGARAALLAELLKPPVALSPGLSAEGLAAALAGHTPAALKYYVRAAALEALARVAAPDGELMADVRSVCLEPADFEAALKLLPRPPSRDHLDRYAAFVAGAVC